MTAEPDNDRVATNPLSNWGRWGETDEVGALNLITPEHVRQSARLVDKGHVVSLARTIRHDVVRVVDRPGPTHVLTVDAGDYALGARTPGGDFVADDYIAMPVATGTHIDALAHVWSADGLYNGHNPNLVRSRGAKACGIDKVAGIVTGGVLADICGLHGVRALPPSHVVTADELEESTKGATEPGDALLIRTGWLTEANLVGRDPRSIEREEPGVGSSAVSWIAERDLAIVGADTLGVEVLPAEEGERGAPMHVILLSKLGVHLIELLDLEELAKLNPPRFLFIAAPLRIRGAVNSPLNPLAVF